MYDCHVHSKKFLSDFSLLSAVFAASFVAPAIAVAQSGQIRLNVDASEAPRRLIHATMQFPVKAGPMSLLYPKWIPGEHGPTGPIEDLTGIRISANGQSIPW